MKTITAKKISETIARLCIEANQVLRPDVLKSLKAVLKKESNKRTKDILESIIKNAGIAKEECLAICQDTGLPIVFLEIGQDVRISGDLKAAVNNGVKLGYEKGYLRKSIILDPLSRRKSDFSPAVIHADIVKGNKIKITVLPKGFGCENKSQLKMFNPTADISQIKDFIIGAVKSAGPDACPPYVIGVGIGGSADYASLLAKKALLRKTIDHRLSTIDPLAKLENELLKQINKLNIGPMGLGGKAACLGVNIETYPTHIAGLPVAVNISCHALRSAAKTI